jgi:triosephosphate isomerase
MPDRIPVLAANWKMHKTGGEAVDFLNAFLPQVDSAMAEVVICPPYTAISAVVEACAGSNVRVAAQNMHEAESGAFTGEVSAGMLVDAGVQGVVLGHSERRQYFNETDDALAQKVPVALAAGLQPILCVGESEAQRDGNETEAVLTRQIEADLAEVGDDQLAQVVIAYEPIWAIGTGKTATTEQAQEACALIRQRVAAREPGAAERVRILYGGSVKPGNAQELISQPDVDGALVGGASLEPDDFAAIVDAASA